MVHQKLLKLRKAESSRKRLREKKRQRKAFFENPFRFTAELLGKPRSGRLRCDQKEAEESIEAAHGDADRQVPLGDCHF